VDFEINVVSWTDGTAQSHHLSIWKTQKCHRLAVAKAAAASLLRFVRAILLTAQHVFHPLVHAGA
jgi:hypothetical protein